MLILMPSPSNRQQRVLYRYRRRNSRQTAHQGKRDSCREWVSGSETTILSLTFLFTDMQSVTSIFGVSKRGGLPLSQDAQWRKHLKLSSSRSCLSSESLQAMFARRSCIAPTAPSSWPSVGQRAPSSTSHR